VTKPIDRARLPLIPCPHCDARARVRTSSQETLLSRELRLQCENIDCGHTFVAQLEIIRTVVQSARPNPAVHLPVGSPRPRHAANDDSPPLPANDEAPASEEAADPMSG